MITLDAKDLVKLSEGFRRYQNAIPVSLARKALKEAAQPTLIATRNLAPVGSVINYSGKTHRGGATRRDVRMLFAKIEGEEIARVFIGVSMKSGKVGWRTHFITKGWTDRSGKFHRGKNFLTEAYDNTIDIVQDNFYKALFSGFIKWSKENLPQ